MRGAFYEANNAASKILSWFSDGPDATRVWQHYTLGKIKIFNIYDTKVYYIGIPVSLTLPFFEFD